MSEQDTIKTRNDLYKEMIEESIASFDPIDPDMYKDPYNVDKRYLDTFRKEQLKKKIVFNGKTLEQLSVHDKLELANKAYNEVHQKLLSVLKDFSKIKDQFNEAKKIKDMFEAEVEKDQMDTMKDVAEHIAEMAIETKRQSCNTTEHLKYESESEKKDESKT